MPSYKYKTACQLTLLYRLLLIAALCLMATVINIISIYISNLKKNK